MQVYDNFLSSVVAHEAYEFVLKSYYKIGWEDSLEPEQRIFPNLHSTFSKEDVERLNILGPVNKKIKDQKLI